MATRYAPMKDGVTLGPAERIVGYDRVVMPEQYEPITTQPLYSVAEWAQAFQTVSNAMPRARDLMRLPALTKPISPPRPIAVIEAEIRRAVTPALRPEDV